MKARRKLFLAALLASVMSLGGPGLAAETKPEGEMRFALYVTVAPAWLDPGEAVLGNLTPFWMLYALHDALVKPMPGNPMANSLAESWTESEDKRVYEFTLRKGVKFHNGDPFTAEDVVFSFKRAKGAQLHEKVKEVVIVDAYKVQFVLHEPWPDSPAARLIGTPRKRTISAGEVSHGRSSEPGWHGSGRGGAGARVWRGGARARRQDVAPAQECGGTAAIARGRPGNRLTRTGRHGSDADRLA